MKKTFITTIFIAYSWLSAAQLTIEKNSSVTDDATKELSEEALKAFEELTRQKMVEFQNELSIVPDKQSYPLIVRRKAIEGLKKKFYDPNESLIEISNLRTKSVNRYPITQYLENLFQLGEKKEVKIEFYEKNKITNFQKTGNGKYEATAVYYQVFESIDTGIKGTQIVYKDKTEKKVEIKLIYAQDPHGGQAYQVFLGNIKVIETSAVKTQ